MAASGATTTSSVIVGKGLPSGSCEACLYVRDEAHSSHLRLSLFESVFGSVLHFWHASQNVQEGPKDIVGVGYQVSDFHNLGNEYPSQAPHGNDLKRTLYYLMHQRHRIAAKLA
jgi:hypothetical protein